MGRHFIFATAFSGAAILWTPAVGQHLEVMEYTCASAVQDAVPVDRRSCAESSLPGPLYLWVRVKGEAAALAVLEAGGQLVIRHKWRRRIGPRADIDTVAAEEEIGAGAVSPLVIEGLRREVDERGFFDWRTWTVKRNLRPTRYGVDIFDHGLKKLTCAIAPEGSESCIEVLVK